MVRPTHGVNRVRLLGRLLIAAGIVLGVVAIVVWRSGLQPAAAPTASPTPSSWSADGADPTAYAAALVVGTNAARAAAGLDALEPSDCATSAAVTRAQELTGGKPLEHAPLAPVITACAPLTTAAENLSRAAAAPQAVVDAWLNSPGHRANLLDPTLTQLGVGCVLDGGQMLCSQVFLGP
jgi:uncharacterized protein YkwD